MLTDSTTLFVLLFGLCCTAAAGDAGDQPSSSTHKQQHSLFWKVVGIPSGALVALVILGYIVKAGITYGCYRCCRSRYPRHFARFESYVLGKLGYQYSFLDVVDGPATQSRLHSSSSSTRKYSTANPFSTFYATSHEADTQDSDSSVVQVTVMGRGAGAAGAASDVQLASRDRD